MHRRPGVRALTALVGAAAVSGLAAAPATAGPPAGQVPPGWITSRIQHMTLEEKVGQLFITYAYGDRADATDPSAGRIMREAGGQQVVMGDFNADWTAPELADLHAYGLLDAWTALGLPDGATYPATAPTDRIDHITMTGGVYPTAAWIPDTLASDHRPLVADLVMTRGIND